MVLKHDILNLLIQNKSKQFTIKEVSKILKIDYKNTYEAVKHIEHSINIDKRSNASYLSFKPIFNNDVFVVENKRKEQIIKKIPLIYKDLKSIKNPFFIPVLFGSFAKGSETKFSDIDICIIHDNEEEVKKIIRILSIHSKLELHIFTYNEFIDMLKINEFNVGKEIRDTGIILHNIESYYEVIKYG